MTVGSVKNGGDPKAADAPGFTASLFGQTFEFIGQHGPKLGWGLLSVGLFAGLWELLWYIGLVDQRFPSTTRSFPARSCVIVTSV